MNSEKKYTFISYIIIFYGIVLRFKEYLSNRSLWIDEAMISLNIVERPFKDFFSELWFDQGAPLGFLTLEKVLVNVFGNNEYVLRAFPLFCGIISIFLFYKLAKEIFSPPISLICLFLFTQIDQFVYYSSEVKPYGPDLTFSLILFIYGVRFFSPKNSFSGIIQFGILGAILCWFSYPTIYVFSSILFLLIFYFIVKNDFLNFKKTLISGLIWSSSFSLLYFLQIKNLNPDILNRFHVSCFMPLPPDYKWLYLVLIRHLFYFLQLNLFFIPQLLFILGIGFFLKKDKIIFLVLIMPLVVTLLASSVYKYVFVDRLLLFYLPVYLIFICKPLEVLYHKKNKYLNYAVLFFVILLIIPPFIQRVKKLFTPTRIEEIRPVFEYIKNNKKPKDIIYLYHSSQFAYKYYAKQYGFNEKIKIEKDESPKINKERRTYQRRGYNTIIIGKTYPQHSELYKKDLKKLQGNERIWILISHPWKREKELIIKYLNELGKLEDSYEEPGPYGGSSVYLYNLKRFK